MILEDKSVLRFVLLSIPLLESAVFDVDRPCQSDIFGSVAHKGLLTAIYEIAYALIARITETN